MTNEVLHGEWNVENPHARHDEVKVALSKQRCGRRLCNHVKLFVEMCHLKSKMVLAASVCISLLLSGCVSVEGLTADLNSGDPAKVENANLVMADAIVHGTVGKYYMKNWLEDEEGDTYLKPKLKPFSAKRFSFDERMALIRTLCDRKMLGNVLLNLPQNESTENTEQRRLFDAVYDRLYEVCGPEDTLRMLASWTDGNKLGYAYEYRKGNRGYRNPQEATAYVLYKNFLKLFCKITLDTIRQQRQRVNKDVNLSRNVVFYGDSIETIVKVAGKEDLLRRWLRLKRDEFFKGGIKIKNPFGEECDTVEFNDGNIIYEHGAVGFTKEFGSDISPKEILESVKTGYGDILKLEEVDHAGVDPVGNYTGVVKWVFETEKYVGAISFFVSRDATDEEKRRSGYDAKQAFNRAVKIAKVGNAILGDAPTRTENALADVTGQNVDELRAKVQVGILAGLYMWGTSSATKKKTLTIYPKIAIEEMRNKHNDRSEQQKKREDMESRIRRLKTEKERKKSLTL